MSVINRIKLAEKLGYSASKLLKQIDSLTDSEVNELLKMNVTSDVMVHYLKQITTEKQVEVKAPKVDVSRIQEIAETVCKPTITDLRNTPVIDNQRVNKKTHSAINAVNTSNTLITYKSFGITKADKNAWRIRFLIPDENYNLVRYNDYITKRPFIDVKNAVKELWKQHWKVVDYPDGVSVNAAFYKKALQALKNANKKA